MNPLAFLWRGPFFDHFKHTDAPWWYFGDLKLALTGATLYVATVLIYKKWFEPVEEPPKAPSTSVNENVGNAGAKKEEKKRKVPSWFKPVSVGHNAFLAVLSLLMFIGMGMAWAEQCQHDGWNACINAHRNGRKGDSYDSALGFWFIIFAASKYIEFVDTYLMMIKSYNIILLHWWHHATVPVLCCFHVLEGTSAAWTGSIFNCLVHTVMYSYYTFAAAGGRFPAKHLVTALQLTQFVTVLGHVGWLWATNGFWAHPWTTFLSFSVYASYLILFIQFSLETYIWKTARGAAKSSKQKGA